MNTKQSRVTVVGAHKRVDVSLPTAAPLGEYSARLARMCGQDDNDLMPRAWSLAIAGEEAFPLEASLADVGVSDGEVLYLRDVATEPGEPPVVEDIDEVVAARTQQIRQDRVRGGPVVIGIGLLWLLAAGLLGARPAGGADLAATLALAGLLLLAVGWGLAQRRTPVPRPVRLAILLTPVACYMTAGYLIAPVLGVAQYHWEGAVAGGNLALVMALLAAPDALLVALLIQFLAALVVVLLIRGFGAGGMGAAAVAAVASVALLAFAHRIASAVVAWNAHIPEASGPAATTATSLVNRSHRMMVAVLAGPLAVLAVALAILARSGNAFGIALAVVIGVALLIRSHQAAFTIEVTGFGGVAAVNGFCVLLRIIRAGQTSLPTAMALLVVAGLVIVGGGLIFMVYGAATPHPPVGPIGTARKPAPWRRRAEGFGVVISVAMIPLAMGTFGVYGHLINFGRNLF